MSQTSIRIMADGIYQSRQQREPHWWEGKALEIIVDGNSFQLGHASGDGCNCLIDTLRQAMGAGVVCNVAAVRERLERRHAGLPSRIVPRDYLELDYWEDIVDLVGYFNLIRPATKPWSPQFRVVCVDLTWLGHGEVFPRAAPGTGRTSLHIARVSQSHFIPLLRLRGDPQPASCR